MKYSGTIRNCYVSGTRGWVISGGSNVTFENNEFENNVYDIAIIAQDGNTNNYTGKVQQISKNNNALVQDQIDKTEYDNGTQVTYTGP